MKSNKKRGFTLVELLVVIAILAILATVSVVGYTSFIERAAVSNDENVASQLNQFLIALQADSNSEYYQVKIDETNVREITRYILSESGLDELEAQSEKYGYHFYFDLANKKYVVAADRDVTSSLATRMFAHAAGEKYFLGSCFTDGNYFLADTKGDLADVINDIYTATDGDGINSAIVAVDSIKDANIKEAVKAFVNSSVIVTDGGNYRVVADPTKVIFTDNVSVVKTETFVKNGNGWPRVDADKLANTDKVVLPNSVACVAENALNINATGEVVINKTPEEVGEMAYAQFTNVNVSINEVDFSFSIEGNDTFIVDVSLNVKVELTYSNPVDSFTVSAEVTDTNKVENRGNEIFVAADAGTVSLVFDFVGEDSTMPATDTSLTWTTSAAGVSVSGNTLTITDKTPKTYTLTATSENGKTYPLTVHVSAITSGSIILGGSTITNSDELNKTIVYTGSEISYSITKDGVYGYTFGDSASASNINFDETITCSYSGSGATVEGTSLKVTGQGSGVLTVNVGSAETTYLTFTVNITIADTSNFALQPKNFNNFTFLGNKNSVLLSDLFEFNSAVPAGAELVVFSGGNYSGDTYMNPNRTQLQESGAGVSVNDARQVISINSASDLANYSLQFSGEDKNNAIRIAVMHNGVRISEDIIVKIVTAINVRTWDELSSNIANNVVFVSDISMPAGNTATLTVGAHTMYGNGFKFDITTGKLGGEEGIIYLTTGGTIRDIRIIGSVYPTFAVSVSEDYGTSAVRAAGGSIINSYIANCRSPLRIDGGEVIVKDTVLFGGRYSNIDITGGKLTVQGTVATVAQLYQNVIGTGITAWFNNTEKIINITSGAVLKQYNFIENSTAVTNSLPEIFFGKYGLGVTIKTSDMFNQLFTDSYAQYHYINNSGVKYVSAGISALDKYRDTNQTLDTLTMASVKDGVYGGSVIYSYSIPAYRLLRSLLASKGIDANPLQMDVRTLLKTNSDNVKLFEEYLQLGDYYYPERYEFRNGSVQFKTFPTTE